MNTQQAIREFKAAIDAAIVIPNSWLKRKGGNPKVAFIAALNIIKNGQEARPYFFPPYFRKRKDLTNRINAVISRAI